MFSIFLLYVMAAKEAVFLGWESARVQVPCARLGESSRVESSFHVVQVRGNKWFF
jgi:hypothetical protein